MSANSLRRYILLPLGFIFLVVFVELGVLARSGPLSLDNNVALWVKTHRTVGDTNRAQVVSALSTPIVVLIVSVLILLFLNYWNRTWYPRDFIPLALVGTAAIVTTVSSSLISRARPSIGLATLYDFEPGYPSSHTVFVAAAGCSFVLYVQRHRFLIFAALCVIGSVVGAASITIGEQWTTDVIGGTFLSWGLLLIFYVLDDWQAEKARLSL